MSVYPLKNTNSDVDSRAVLTEPSVEMVLDWLKVSGTGACGFYSYARLEEVLSTRSREGVMRRPSTTEARPNPVTRNF